MSVWKSASAAVAAILLSALPALGQDALKACTQMLPDKAEIGGDRTISVLRSKSGTAAILLASVADDDDKQMNVNSDGSPRAYHLLDPEGRR